MPAPTLQRRWSITPADAAAVRSLASDAGLSEVVARILVARGITDGARAHRFLTPDLERDWRDPCTIPGMADAAGVVADAITGRERIAVFGDFDADGVTATAVLVAGFRRLGGDVSWVLPHRIDDGYGLSESAVARLRAERPALVVTVDCGIASADEVAALVASGIRVVVTDHHEPGEGVPSGVPVVDPKLPGAPFDGLAGAGVALKLLHAVGRLLGDDDVWLDVADIAALGTIADVVPLIDENRALVAYGLERMRTGPRPGIAALARAAGLDPAALNADSVSYTLAPRVNAAGRVDDPDVALELLLEEDPVRADGMAAQLDAFNRRRQTLEQDLLSVARAAADAAYRPGDRVLVLAGEGWHEGVKGIVAGRLAAHFGVPALLFVLSNGVAHGSGRSVAGVDLHAAVTEAADLLTRFGGHAAAVGVTLPAAQLDAFRDRLSVALGALPSSAFEPVLSYDAEVHLPDVSRQLLAELEALGPFGHGNPRPLLVSRSVFMNGRKRVGSDGGHLRFEAYDGVASLPAIAFRCPDVERLSGWESAVDVAYTAGVDEWQGRERLQLMVRDLAVKEADPTEPAAALVDELFADADRILARGEYEGIADAESFHTKLAGVSFEGRQEVVARLAPDDPLRLERQPDNPHDPCACALFDSVGDQVGFLNRRLAAVLAPAIDAGAAYDVAVADVTGGQDGASLGVNVVVSRRDTGERLELAGAAERRTALAALAPSELDEALRAHLIGDRPLHEAQARSLEHLAAGRSCLTVMATGRGKSLIFHLHAAREALARGRASVLVYPLRALVADQAFHLASAMGEIGLRVGVITGETAPGGRDEMFAGLGSGSVDVLMTTPEFLERHAGRFAAAGRVGFVVVDESHHVGLSRAGHRPAYARLGEALETLGRPTVLACTATAPDEVAQAVRGTLGIGETVIDATVRENLRIADRRGAGDKATYVAALAGRGEKVIVYVNSREQSVRVAQRVRAACPELVHRTAFYNGGMARAARNAVERAFREGAVSTVVATSAFGEGVNIADVRHVVLMHLPFGSTEFNQMCGRCGRDGLPATVHLLFGEKDARLNELILESGAPDLDELRTLYAVLRDRAAEAPDGWLESTNAELADEVRRRRRGSRITDRGVSSGIGVFRELGFVSGEGVGSYRRLRLEAPPEDKVDLTASVRYAEGLEEADAFRRFRDWALRAPSGDLVAAFDRPILPLS